jgi:hypothetical protein
MELKRGKPISNLKIRGNEGNNLEELTGIEPATAFWSPGE